VDAQPGAPEHHDQRAQAEAVRRVSPWRMTATISSTVGGSAGYRRALVARRSAGVEARHRGRRSATAGGIEQHAGHGTLLTIGSAERDAPLGHGNQQRERRAAEQQSRARAQAGAGVTSAGLPGSQGHASERRGPPSAPHEGRRSIARAAADLVQPARWPRTSMFLAVGRRGAASSGRPYSATSASATTCVGRRRTSSSPSAALRAPNSSARSAPM
jgi:hypothetical protein